jgi:hypothetical protein
MEWDLGLYGLGVLLLMSLVFGLAAALLTWTTATHWMGVIAAGVYFVAGLFISEVFFGWATEVELQPNIDGLSFDEVLLGATLTGVVVVGVMWYLTRRSAAGHTS